MTVTPISEFAYAVKGFAEELDKKASAGGVEFIAYVIEFSDGTVGHGFIGGLTDEYQVAGHLHALQNLLTEGQEDG